MSVTGGLSELAQFVESTADAVEGHALVLAWDELVREYTNVWSVELVGQIDEAASLVHVRRGPMNPAHLGRSI